MRELMENVCALGDSNIAANPRVISSKGLPLIVAGAPYEVGRVCLFPYHDHLALARAAYGSPEARPASTYGAAERNSVMIRVAYNSSKKATSPQVQLVRPLRVDVGLAPECDGYCPRPYVLSSSRSRHTERRDKATSAP